MNTVKALLAMALALSPLEVRAQSTFPGTTDLVCLTADRNSPNLHFPMNIYYFKPIPRTNVIEVFRKGSEKLIATLVGMQCYQFSGEK